MRATSEEPGRSALFVNGPGYPGTDEARIDLVTSGFTTVFLWSLHVHEEGDLYLNERRIVSGGAYDGDADWPAWVNSLKTTVNTRIDRVELSVGSSGASDWENIRDLLGEGGGTGNILYKNFTVLHDLLDVDALSSDDESCYDVASTVAFAKMAQDIGYRNFTLTPFTEVEYWKDVKGQLGPLVDRVYLQCYSGGSGNDPRTWQDALGMPVDPGLWCKHGPDCDWDDSPAEVEDRMRQWQESAGIVGGFLWSYPDVLACAKPGRKTADYAAAIKDGITRKSEVAAASQR
ncbi:lysyl endopeptidase [Saccharothrix sp. HUAS TT1]|uniref:lysyl endopeptidase n=1 Tax=unclassified Saccharothrix TaxID=2593673 RepID=UPI00345C5A95